MQFRNSRAELNDQMMGKTCFNIIRCLNSGIERNSYQFLPIPTNSLFVQFRNQTEFLGIPSNSYQFRFFCNSGIPDRNWMIKWWVRHASISFNALIPESNGIPRNSYRFLRIPLLCNFGIPGMVWVNSGIDGTDSCNVQHRGIGWLLVVWQLLHLNQQDIIK